MWFWRSRLSKFLSRSSEREYSLRWVSLILIIKSFMMFFFVIRLS